MICVIIGPSDDYGFQGEDVVTHLEHLPVWCCMLPCAVTARKGVISILPTPCCGLQTLAGMVCAQAFGFLPSCRDRYLIVLHFLGIMAGAVWGGRSREERRGETLRTNLSALLANANPENMVRGQEEVRDMYQKWSVWLRTSQSPWLSMPGATTSSSFCAGGGETGRRHNKPL